VEDCISLPASGNPSRRSRICCDPCCAERGIDFVKIPLLLLVAGAAAGTTLFAIGKFNGLVKARRRLVTETLGAGFSRAQKPPRPRGREPSRIPLRASGISPCEVRWILWRRTGRPSCWNRQCASEPLWRNPVAPIKFPGVGGADLRMPGERSDVQLLFQTVFPQ